MIMTDSTHLYQAAIVYSDLIIRFIQHVVATTTWDQVMLGILGITAIRLTQHPNVEYQKYACVVGLLGQPFWLYATYSKDLWIMFLICCLYTHAWWKGFERWHLKRILNLILNAKNRDTR